jgi:hypothetical protein
MIILEFPRNINTLLQGYGRLRRMNQKMAQQILILIMHNSFDTYLEAQAAAKYVLELQSELEFPTGVSTNAKLVLIHLVIAQMLGQSSSKLFMATLDFDFLPQLKKMVAEVTDAALHHLAAPEDETALKAFEDSFQALESMRSSRAKQLKAERRVLKKIPNTTIPSGPNQSRDDGNQSTASDTAPELAHRRPHIDDSDDEQPPPKKAQVESATRTMGSVVDGDGGLTADQRHI